MYSLEDDVNTDSGGSGIGVFKPGVNVRFMSTKGQIPLFKIMPAFDPTTLQMEGDTYKVTDKTSWVPFRDPETHTLSVFARKIRVAGFIGHGRGKDGRRSDLLSPLTFGKSEDGTDFCPLRELFRAAESDPRWDYLTKDKIGPDGQTVTDRQPLSYPTTQLIANIVDVTATPPKAELGVFSASACNALLKKQDPVGLVWQTSNVPDPTIIQNNPLARWATGDLTHPETGPVLTMGKLAGKYGKYTMEMHKDQSGNIVRVSIPDYLLEQRYNLHDIDSIVKRMSDEELIKKLAQLINGINPNTGEHEWVLLKQVFGNMVGNDIIPDPPAAGYTQGWTAPQQQQQMPPQQGQPPQQQGSLLGGTAAPPQVPPGAVPAVPPQQPAQPGIPTMDNPNGQPPQTPQGVQPPQVPPADNAGQSLMSQANTDANNSSPTPQEAPSGTEGNNEAPVPGDTPPKSDFSPDNFMERLQNMQGNQQ
jgi:hypothetical protein